MEDVEIALHQSSLGIFDLLHLLQALSKPFIEFDFAFKVLKNWLVFQHKIPFGLDVLDVGGDEFFMGTYTPQIPKVAAKELPNFGMQFVQLVDSLNDFVFLELYQPSQDIAVTQRVVVGAKQIQVGLEGLDELIAEKHVDEGGLILHHFVYDQQRSIDDILQNHNLCLIFLRGELLLLAVLQDGSIETANLINEVVEGGECFFEGLQLLTILFVEFLLHPVIEVFQSDFNHGLKYYMRAYLKQGKYSYSDEDLLGQGTFGKVYRGYNHHDNHWMALKQIELSKLEKYGDELKTIILSEINVMKKFRQHMNKQPCPYIVSHEDCFRTEKYIYIAMELCNGGTLEDYLKNRHLSEIQAIQILSCLTKGLYYMTKLGITHRDIKPQNIFIGTALVEEKEKMVFKIGDFGFADRKQDYDIAMGTLPYMAPEMFKKQKYTGQVDIWSIGVIAHEIIFKNLYFLGKDKWQFQKNIQEKPFALTKAERQLISDEYFNYIHECLVKDPQHRITAAKLVLHPVFNKLTLAVDIFTKVQGLVDQCKKMRQMAESFCVFGEKTNRRTQFIQIYLLKEAYAMINRINYTVVHKQDYIGVDEGEFQQLTDPSFESKYESLKEKSQLECVMTTNLFNHKFKEFSQYLLKFDPQDQGLISQTVDQNPYTYVHAQVFEKEISKWAKSLKEYEGWAELQGNCQKMAIIRAQND